MGVLASDSLVLNLGSPLVGCVFSERQPRYKCLVPHLQSRITTAFKVKKGGTLKYRI